MKRTICSTILISLIIILTFSISAMAEIDTIKVVIDDNYPPFSFRSTSGELNGISIDHWKLFEEKTGIKVEIFGTNWNDAQELMKREKFDVIDTMFKSEEREKIYDFTESYAEIATSMYFYNSISGITDIESAKGFTVASKKGGYSVEVLEKSGIESIILYDSYEDIINAANESEIVMFIMDQPSAVYYLYKLGIQDEYNYTEPVYSNYFYRAVKEGNTELLTILNSGFDKITVKEINQINEKWYGKSSLLNSEYIHHAIIIVSSLVALLIILFLMSLYLKFKVDQKTKELSVALMSKKTLNQHLQAVLNAIPDLIFVLDGNGVFRDDNIKEQKGALYSKTEFIGKSIEDLLPSEIAKGLRGAFEKFKESNTSEPYEYSLFELGENSIYQLRFSRINEDRILAIVHDITEQKEIEKRIIKFANNDILTGIYNRNYFEKYTSDIDEKSNHYGILICDVDAMKFINDTLGHLEGDKHLEHIAELLKDNIPEDSLLARIGGDEFAVIINDVSTDIMEEIKKKIKSELSKNTVNNTFIDSKLSIGYAVKENDSDIFREVFKKADNEMYLEKLSHRYSFKTGNVSLLIKMLEERNLETKEHAQKLDEYCVAVAKKLNSEESFINRISLFAKFHDIGKIGISDSILLKPDKLTKYEYEEIKKYAEIGYRIAKSITEIENIADLIYRHHEWYNGEGYPFKIKGEEIPLECRILSVVDAYDAMISDRPYRKAISKEEAVKELIRFKSIQFDPQIVDLFIEILNNDSEESIINLLEKSIEENNHM